jgi:hypothetical protein
MAAEPFKGRDSCVDGVVPPQNLVDSLIVEVSALGVKLTYPDD